VHSFCWLSITLWCILQCVVNYHCVESGATVYLWHLIGVCWIGLLASSVPVLKHFTTSAAQSQIPASRSSMKTSFVWYSCWFCRVSDALLWCSACVRGIVTAWQFSWPLSCNYGSDSYRGARQGWQHALKCAIATGPWARSIPKVCSVNVEGEQGGVENGGGIPFPSCLGNVVSFPSGIWGRGPAKIGFCKTWMPKKPSGGICFTEFSATVL